MRAGTFLTEEIERGPAGPKVGAFFDVDGTLLSGFSGIAFWRDRLLSGQMSASDLSENLLAWVGFQRGQIGFSGILTAWSSMLRGTLEQDLVDTGERLFEEELAALVFPESRALVQAHLRRGHTVAIVSAATRYQVEPLARDLGIERVLCTQLEVDPEGHFTGQYVRPACWGEGKATAVRALAAAEGLDLAQSYFYSDAAEDLPLFEIVGRPRPTNPDKRLGRIAEKRAWPQRRFGSRGRPSFADVVRTGLSAMSSGLALALGVPLALVTGRPKAAFDFALGAWGDLGTALAGIELRVRGEEHLWSSRPAVFIFNHQSALDVLILCKLLRRDFVGVAKQELRRVPLFGALAALTGTVFVDRADSGAAIRALQPAVDALRMGTSLAIAPEGTRAPTPRLGRFKKGAFHMAMQARVPIVPIVIKNALDALPKSGLVIRPATLEVVVLPPVPTRDWKRETIDQHIADVRALYEEVLGD
ncbi:MAG TPA: HAD-IB family hydrolase [Myxococcota bacterium]|nr:HAD-IB family hydrolase [Myxococcota bacterium]